MVNNNLMLEECMLNMHDMTNTLIISSVFMPILTIYFIYYFSNSSQHFDFDFTINMVNSDNDDTDEDDDEDDEDDCNECTCGNCDDDYDYENEHNDSNEDKEDDEDDYKYEKEEEEYGEKEDECEEEYEYDYENDRCDKHIQTNKTNISETDYDNMPPLIGDTEDIESASTNDTDHSIKFDHTNQFYTKHDINNNLSFRKRMMKYEEITRIKCANTKINKSTPFIVRLKLSFSRDFYKKYFYNKYYQTTMIEVTADLIETFGAATGYTSGCDEIILVFSDIHDDSNKKIHIYGGKVHKLITNISSFAAVKFNKYISNYEQNVPDFDNNDVYEYPATFNARVVAFPNKYELINYIIWRQYDTIANNTINIGKKFVTVDNKKPKDITSELKTFDINLHSNEYAYVPGFFVKKFLADSDTEPYTYTYFNMPHIKCTEQYEQFIINDLSYTDMSESIVMTNVNNCDFVVNCNYDFD